MISFDKTEALIKHGKAKVRTGAKMDKRVLEDAIAAMDESLNSERPTTTSNFSKWVLSVSAAAAVLAIAIPLLMLQPEPSQQIVVQDPVQASPVKQLNMLSLTLAYHRGGIEAVDRQSSQAYAELGTQRGETKGLSMQELLSEGNGV